MKKQTTSSDDYPLLRDEKPNQFITRVDKWSITRYYDDENGNRVSELLFYPSPFGFEQISIMAEDVLMSDKAAAFVYRRDRLLMEGDARWEV
jgi:hypothetical protein